MRLVARRRRGIQDRATATAGWREPVTAAKLDSSFGRIFSGDPVSPIPKMLHPLQRASAQARERPSHAPTMSQIRSRGASRRAGNGSEACRDEAADPTADRAIGQAPPASRAAHRRPRASSPANRRPTRAHRRARSRQTLPRSRGPHSPHSDHRHDDDHRAQASRRSAIRVAIGMANTRTSMGTRVRCRLPVRRGPWRRTTGERSCTPRVMNRARKRLEPQRESPACG